MYITMSFRFLCCVCLRPVSCVYSVASISGLHSFIFINIYSLELFNTSLDMSQCSLFFFTHMHILKFYILKLFKEEYYSSANKVKVNKDLTSRHGVFITANRFPCHSDLLFWAYTPADYNS